MWKHNRSSRAARILELSLSKQHIAQDRGDVPVAKKRVVVQESIITKQPSSISSVCQCVDPDVEPITSIQPGGFPIAVEPDSYVQPGGFPITVEPDRYMQPGGFPIAVQPDTSVQPGGFPIALEQAISNKGCILPVNVHAGQHTADELDVASFEVIVVTSHNTLHDTFKAEPDTDTPHVYTSNIPIVQVVIGDTGMSLPVIVEETIPGTEVSSYVAVKNQIPMILWTYLCLLHTCLEIAMSMTMSLSTLTWQTKTTKRHGKGKLTAIHGNKTRKKFSERRAYHMCHHSKLTQEAFINHLKEVVV
jgi:hypothetical protein